MRTGVPTLFLICLGAGPLFAEEPPSRPSAPLPTQTSCFGCHSLLEGAALEPTRLAAEDIHFQKGLSCHDCHGGDPTATDDMEASHDPGKGWTGKPDRLRIPDFCAR